MMTTVTMGMVQINDAELVAESLHGNRDSFRQIVERYQTLISSLAYCATGDVSRDQAISDEEKAILWRSLERIPEIYREPLVLFYREHQSIEAVAQDLGLSEDAVKQRLSRGRKLLQEQFFAFVAGAVNQTKPGKAFTLGVISALPSLVTTAKAATVGTALAQHGSAAAKTTSLGGFLQATSNILLGFVYWLAPVVPLGGYIGYKMGGDRQHSERACRSVAGFWRVVGASMLLFAILPLPVLALIQRLFNLPVVSLKPFGLIWAVKLLSSSASNGESAGRSSAGCTNLRACGLTRTAEGPDSESGSLGGASPFMPTISPT